MTVLNMLGLRGANHEPRALCYFRHGEALSKDCRLQVGEENALQHVLSKLLTSLTHLGFYTALLASLKQVKPLVARRLLERPPEFRE